MLHVVVQQDDGHERLGHGPDSGDNGRVPACHGRQYLVLQAHFVDRPLVLRDGRRWLHGNPGDDRLSRRQPTGNPAGLVRCETDLTVLNEHLIVGLRAHHIFDRQAGAHFHRLDGTDTHHPSQLAFELFEYGFPHSGGKACGDDLDGSSTRVPILHGLDDLLIHFISGFQIRAVQFGMDAVFLTDCILIHRLALRVQLRNHFLEFGEDRHLLEETHVRIDAI